MNIKLALSILGFLLSNAAELRKMVLGIQEAVGDILPGEDKANAVKAFIARALDITDRIDAGWAIIRPIFDLLVKAWKTAKAAEPPANGSVDAGIAVTVTTTEPAAQ